MTRSDDEERRIQAKLDKLGEEALLKFPDDEISAHVWLQEQIHKLNIQHPTIMRALTEKPQAEIAVKTVRDAFEMFPEDEDAAMEWMRESIESRGVEASKAVLELHRQAYRRMRKQTP